jgi:CofD-related protein of GAK system
MALADRTVRGYPEIRTLFSYRLAHHHSQGRLECEIQEMIAGEHPLISSIPLPMRSIIRRYIRRFHSNMPRFFDLHGANIGNIVLTGGFLANDRDLESILFIFSKLVQVRGRVTTIVPESLHLAARLADATTHIGQHMLTGKEVPPISSAITDLYLCHSLTDPQPASCTIADPLARQIASADLICYPMGSFFTSLVANLLPHGVGKAIQRATCPKIFIPSTGHDPEVYGHDLTALTNTLLTYLTRDDPASIAPQDVLNFILVDTRHGSYPGSIDPVSLQDKGIQILDTELISPTYSPAIDPTLLAQLLISLT